MTNLKTILIAATMLFLSNSLMAQETKEYVTVSTLMGNITGAGFPHEYVISYPDGKTEKGSLESVGRNLEANTNKLNEIFNMLAKKDYKLVSSNGGDTYATYIFVKE